MFLTSDDRLALMQDQWIRDAKALFIQHANVTPQDAQGLAETLFVDSGNDEWGFDWVSAQDAVNEELSYWGE